MPTAEKTAAIEQLRETFDSAAAVFLADFTGLNVEKMTDLRRKCRSEGIELKVIKNTLLRRAIDGTDKEGIGDFLGGMTGVVLSGDDPIASAKALRELTKDLQKEEKFIIKGGWFRVVILPKPSFRYCRGKQVI